MIGDLVARLEAAEAKSGRLLVAVRAKQVEVESLEEQLAMTIDRLQPPLRAFVRACEDVPAKGLLERLAKALDMAKAALRAHQAQQPKEAAQ